MADKANAATPASEWSARTTDADQKKFPVKIAAGLLIGAFCWIVAYLGSVAVMLPARVAEIDSAHKASIIALNSTIAMVVATIANLLIGASSDLSRTRWGRRTPWICVGSAGALASLAVLGQVTTGAGLIAAWAVYQIFLNAIIAPLLATLSDRIAPRFRGSAASSYALGIGLGTGLGQIIGSRFIGDTSVGLVVLGVLTALAAPAAIFFFREASSLGMPKKAFSKEMVLDNFVFARRDARDYYLALFGKFFIMLAKFSVQGYLLFILTDYMSLAKKDAGHYIALSATIIMFVGIGLSLLSGPLADKLKRIKLPVVVSSLFIGAGVFVPFLAATPQMIVGYAVLAGIGFGIFNAVDQALNISVLPNPATAAKDLGIINFANTGGQIAGPILSAAVIGIAGYHWIFAMAACSAVVAAVLFLSIRRVR